MNEVRLVWVWVLCMLASGVLAQAQSPYLPDTYRSPVDHPIKVSGTFGELRSDHFHMGLDIKSSRGVVGDPIYAVAEGFVSRIKVSAAGYGNAIYVDHPNGTRSLYAHLDTYAPDLQRYIDSAHYAREVYELDIEDLGPTDLPIERGQLLGTMGNTGSSFGAHLHFELRLSENDAAFNPLLYDFAIQDSRAPEIRGLSIYTRLPNGATHNLERVTPRSTNGSYSLRDTLHVPPGEIGFGVKAYDRQEGTQNSNGVFMIEGETDGKRFWQSRYDTVSFEQTRYIQAHYDYLSHRSGGGYFYRLHRLPGDKLSLYAEVENNGFIDLSFGESRNVLITTCDAFGNAAVLTFTVLADGDAEMLPAPTYNYLVKQGEAANLAIADATLDLAADAVYTDTYLTTRASTDVPAEAYSRCYTIGSEEEPLHASAKLRIPLYDVPMELRPNAYVSPCDNANRTLSGTLTTGSTHLEVEVKNWGAYVLRLDTRKPTIRRLNRYTYLLSDDVTRARYLRYRVTQNGDWVLATFDAKNNRLELRRDKLGSGEIKVEVWDAAGNKREI